MPSFLNKVFGYKKHDDKEVARPTREASDSTLLDGKYEAIAPVLSPSASTFDEAQQSRDVGRDAGFSLFRPKARGVSQKAAQKHLVDVPHLTLQLPGPKENRALGIVFEADPNSQIVLDDAVIAAKRLDPLEALILIRACTLAITERGLETLGIMHPHWFSASPDVQRRLISLFIRSLTQNRITTLSPTPTSSTSAFENELHYTRSPHDVAAVLRWGLRHLSLENGHFGKDGAEWGWYNAFFQAERNASYPPKGFSELLLPLLPPSHVELLTATLSLISSLASHAEANSISGSKLSKFLGLWLLVAARAEESDDWNRFYARWERGGRILEHLFLARLREESSGQRLPTRLQELVKYYPYNKGSPATGDDLLSRPRFSTRQYDALFVRVESLLAHSAEQPKQHPIQLLLEAFQLPIDDPSGNEHIALWNVLKTTAFAEETPSDPEGPQFTRIFVDETIRLLSLIPADNNSPTSPTLFTSPITKVVSRKRSSSVTRAYEHTISKSNASIGSTPVSPPVSPTSPSSIVNTDWAQFALGGFGGTPTTQPLVALLSQDDDVEVTQPRVSRKSSRHRGKSRTRRRRSEDREPLDTLPSSQPDAEPSIVETKLASVHVVQIDEAFIDFWSDAIVDPISANWPTFVICGLKQTPSDERPIHWLIIEQAYGRQEPQPSRVPSPDGRRGRSPRPSFKSDISGFRINSVFSSARKRFSMFNKSATDLDLKKSGGKTPVAGELGEVLVEEEPTFPCDPPTKAGLHVDANATARAAVTSGATADVSDHLKAGEISAAPIAGPPPPPAPKVESDPVQAVVKAPSIEPTPQSIGGYNGSSVLPRPSVRASEETISVERDSPRPLDVVDPKVDIIAPLTADTPHSRSTLDICDPKVTSGPAFAEEVHIQAEIPWQGVPTEAEDQPVELVAQITDRDERLHAEAKAEPSDVVHVDVADNGLREDTEVVAMPPTPETVALVAATPAIPPAVVGVVDDKAPEPAVEEPHVAKQPLQKASADPVAAFTVESVGRHEIDDLSPLSSTEIIATETGVRLEPHSITSVVDEEAQEIAGHAEIPTPVSELVTLVEETPGQEASADVCGRAGATRTPAAQPEVLDGAPPQLVVLDDAASQPVTAQPVAAELQATLQEESFVIRPVETPCVEVVDANVQVVATETEPAADQAPELPAEEAQPHVQDAVVQTAEAPLVEAFPAHEAEADVSAGIVSTSHAEDVARAEVGAQAAPTSFVHEDLIVETQDTGMPSPLPEHAASINETPDPVIATDAHGSVKAAPAITSEVEEVEAETQDPVVEAVVEAKTSPTVYMPLTEEAQPPSGAELSTQVRDTQAAAEALSTGSNLEAVTAALATLDEVIAVKAGAQSALDDPTHEAEAHTPTPESVPVEDTLEVTVQASEPALSTAVESEHVEHQAPERVAEEAQLILDPSPTASEPVAITPVVPIEEPVVQDVQSPIEIDEPSSVSAPQFVDEAVNPPTIVVGSVPEEIVTVQVEAPLEPEVTQLTVDTIDEPLAQDAKPVPVAPEHGVSAEEIQVVVDVSEPEALAVEPELAEVSAPTLVEDAPAPVEAEESSVAVGVSEKVVASQPEINETTEVDQPPKVANLVEPMTSEISVSTHESAGLSEEIAAAEP